MVTMTTTMIYNDKYNWVIVIAINKNKPTFYTPIQTQPNKQIATLTPWKSAMVVIMTTTMT